ncbi:hypothetical protein FKV24_017125 [Lysobacter maris]|uniref:Uncharacterized protein n=1 Tax=Marilutibacter maris TaxID=1605891 RepID=A0A507ZVA5_9GAMM|nr:hypothetical protein [Lysobacter maris]KAB8165677.1 hypothetical protein FKV24_017125 [Lysobacter maris]
MRRLLKCLAVVAVAVVAVGAGLFLVSRAMGRNAERMALVERLATPKPVSGSNAFPALWTFGYRVPQDRVQAAAATDVERFQRRLDAGEDLEATGFDSGIAADFEDLLASVDGSDTAWCSPRKPGCLQRVGDDADGYAQRLRPLEQVLAQADALGGYGHYANGFPAHLHAPFPGRLNALLRIPMTSHALDFVQGDSAAALAGVCHSAAGWRRLVPNSDSLVISMLAINAVRGYSDLFADMLAELPADTPLPAGCMAAFAPPVEGEIGVCEAIKGEFAMQRVLIRDPSAAGTPMPWYYALAYDRSATEGRAAENLSLGCDARGQSLIAADKPIGEAVPERSQEFECLSNFFGCTLTSIAGPAYSDYLRRTQDHGMRLKLMAALVWLRENRDDRRPVATRLASRPVTMRSPARRIELGEDGRSLRIELYDAKDGSHWQVPLPRMR